jgi:hypothetical protein
MVIEINKATTNSFDNLLEQFKRKPRKSLAAHFGKLKRGLDGLEYQKSCRNEWD